MSITSPLELITQLLASISVVDSALVLELVGLLLRYELVNGGLVEMPPARGLHALIIDALNDMFKAEIKRMGRNWISLHSSIGVQIPQYGRRSTSRIPDICVVTSEQWQGLLNKSAVLEDSPPLLVVEVDEGTKIVD